MFEKVMNLTYMDQQGSINSYIKIGEQMKIT